MSNALASGVKNAGKMGTGAKIGIALFIIVFLVGIGLLIAYAVNPDIFNTKKEGDECKGDDDRGTYEIDEDGECVLASCMTGWEKSGTECVKKSSAVVAAGTGTGTGTGTGPGPGPGTGTASAAAREAREAMEAAKAAKAAAAAAVEAGDDVAADAAEVEARAAMARAAEAEVAWAEAARAAIGLDDDDCSNADLIDCESGDVPGCTWDSVQGECIR